MFKKLCVAAAMMTVAASSFAGELVINGSTTVLPIVQKATEAFSKENPSVSISLSGGGSGNGIKALVDGLTTIAMSSRDIKASETELAKKNNVNPYRIPVAYDPIVPVVNNTHPFKTLTMPQLHAHDKGQIHT